MKFEDTINPNSQKVSKRKAFTLNGRLHKIDYFDDVTAIKTKEEYYDKKGDVYLKKHFTNDEENKLIDIEHLTKRAPLIMKKLYLLIIIIMFYLMEVLYLMMHVYSTDH